MTCRPAADGHRAQLRVAQMEAQQLDDVLDVVVDERLERSGEHSLLMQRELNPGAARRTAIVRLGAPENRLFVAVDCLTLAIGLLLQVALN